MKENKDIMLFPNWVDTASFFPLSEKHLIKRLWNFSENDKLVLYSGSIGEKQGLEVLINIAFQLQEYQQIKFIICGSGPFKDKLKQMVEILGLRNVFFLPLQTSDSFNQFLNMADVHLILQKGDASDLVMPSKLTTILAVGGLALVTAAPETTLFDVVQSNRMGVVVPPENELLLKEAILNCCNLDYIQERNNARVYAEKFLNRDAVLSKMLEFFV